MTRSGRGHVVRDFFIGPNRDEYHRDRLAFWALLLAGAAVVLYSDGEGARPWLALMSAIVSLVFVIVYSFRPWRKTYAGRAAMLSMCVTLLYTSNASLILWWPRYEYGYPYWADITEFVYLAILIAVLYKLRALTRSSVTRRHEPPDPTV